MRTVTSLDNLAYFPVRRICALGVPREALDEVHAQLPFVAIEDSGASLQSCDLLVINENERGAKELVRWVRERLPQFPIVFWSASAQLAADCKRLLFPGGPFTA